MREKGTVTKLVVRAGEKAMSALRLHQRRGVIGSSFLAMPLINQLAVT